MSEFGEQRGQPDPSMALSIEEFNAAVLNVADNYPDELAYELLTGCLDEDANGQDEAEVRFKRGLVFKFMGHIEAQRGDNEQALASYRQAIDEFSTDDFDEVWQLELRLHEGHLLMEGLNDRLGAIGPYEEVVRIFDDTFTRPDSEIAPDRVFVDYTHVLSHLARCYVETGRYEEARRVNSRLAVFGRVAGAMYDSADSGQRQPIFDEITAKLTVEASLDEPERQVEGLRGLEVQVDSDDFLPEAPEEREHVLMMIYGRYGMLLPDANERLLYVGQALSIAKRHRLFVPQVDLHLSQAANRKQLGRPMNEQHKAAKGALRAAEAAMDAGASVEAAHAQQVMLLMMKQLEAKGDYIGIEKLQRRFNERGLRIQRTDPGAARPDLN